MAGKVGGKFLFHWFPPTRYPPTQVMFIALKDCSVDYECHVEFGDVMLGLLLPADGGAALFRNVDTT